MQHNKHLVLIAASLFFFTTAFAQVDTTFIRTMIPLDKYLNLVGQQNLNYAAQKYNVNIAEAGIEIAKVFPDPQLSAGVFNNQHNLGQGYDAGISTTIELGGKRKARINLAQSQAELSKALLEDYFRNLRADAAIDYYQSLLKYNLLQVSVSSYTQMRQLANADSIRFKAGDITEIDARQSKLEADDFLNNVFQSEADLKTALTQLNINIGKSQGDTLLMPVGNFEHMERNFVLADLITQAQNNRTDIVAALNNRAVADNNLQLVKAGRRIDLGISAGTQYNTESTNNIAPVPAYRNINAGLSIPLKFSNHYKGDLAAANYSVKQAETQYEQALLQVQVEVTQSFVNYQSAQKQAEQFKSGLLSEAEKVLDGKMYSYKRGETSLLDVLNAQRTYNDIRQEYYQALFNYASALVNVERAAGIWDIQ